MDKNIVISFGNLQDDGSWADEANSVDLAQDGEITSDVLDLTHSQGIVQIQVSHTGAGSPTITGDIYESVDGVTFVKNGTGFCATLAKATPTLYTHDAKANRFLYLFVAEDNVAATALTLSVGVK